MRFTTGIAKVQQNISFLNEVLAKCTFRNYLNKQIQHWLRHSDAQTTAKFYLHTDEEELVRVGAGVEDMYNKFTTKKEITK